MIPNLRLPRAAAARMTASTDPTFSGEKGNQISSLFVRQPRKR